MRPYTDWVSQSLEKVSLNEFIKLCEKVVDKKAIYEQIGDQLGDVPHTYADIHT